jgi:hypothetical protein
MTRLLAVVLLALPVFADEGMWTFDNPPVDRMRKNYNFTPTREWLDHVRLASARLNDGGSGSFVSPNGLLLTNHHVARGQLQKSSTAEHDYIRDGFLAATPEQEIKCPDLEVNVLVSMEDVTARVLGALKKGQTPEQSFAARKSAMADIERESQNKTGLRSEIVTLYQGGEYWLYRYKNYTDIRIVFAPEQQAAYFGGDPDNFTFPRHDIDMALFRVYDNGKPISSKDYLKWNPKGAADGELVFVSGHPGSTERLDTVAQLRFERDSALPLELKLLRDRIAVLRKYSAESPERARQASSEIFNMENSVKALDGEYQGLLDPHIMAKKEKEEAEFRARIDANPEWKAQYGQAWDEIAAAEQKAATRIKEAFFHKMNSELGTYAMQIVDYAAEIKKPDGERLAGYHDSQLESLRFGLASPAPIYKDMEIARIAGALAQDLQEMGPDDPYVKTILAGRTPRAAAESLVNGTKLDDPAVRKQLLEGGEAAVAASTDTMIVLARKLDATRREYIKWSEDNVESVAQRAGEQLGKARFAVYGKSTYPDATFTLRLSYGTVKGYPMNGTVAPSKTTFYGLYDRAASFDFKEPWNLTSRFAEGRSKLNLATPLDFVATTDIIGGNSGSPVINRNGELVGLIFDGNIESLVGNYVYDGERNRAVAVHTAAMTEVMSKLYGAQKLLDEIMR